MKKTLTALCFALCATFAFAQTNKTSQAKDNRSMAPVKIENAAADQQASFKGSIFTKAEGDVLLSNEFNTVADITFGTLGANDVVAGDTMGSYNLAHTQNFYGASWQRVTDTTSTYFQNNSANWPVMAYLTGNWGRFPVRSNDPCGGYMLMAMCEQIGAWNGTNTTGGFNAYMQFSFDGSNAGIADVIFYQRYRKFNNDMCFIDYSFDNGATWNTTQINVRGIDMAVNDDRNGYIRTTIPTGNADNCLMRIRWCAASNANGGGAYGYWWAIDDLEVIEGANNRLTNVLNEYFEGVYQQMPQGLQVPIVWNASIRNGGANNQTNVTGKLYTMTANGAATLAGSQNLGTVSSLKDTAVSFDPKGWYAMNGFGYTGDPTQNVPCGPSVILPTTTTGKNYFFGDVTSDTWEHIYKLTDDNDNVIWMTYDTIVYKVNPVQTVFSFDPAGAAVWARDNGVLTSNSTWAYGMVNEGTFTGDPADFEGWRTAGYTVYNSYVTGDNVPANWCIKGMQLVASSNAEHAMAGGSIYADLRRDSVYVSGTSMYCSFKGIETGSSDVTITDAHLNEGVTEYVVDGYNVINIDFPNQPALEPNTAYRVGYGLSEDCNFAVAANVNYYYDEQGTGHSFYSTPGMEEYSALPAVNRYATIIWDPLFTSDGNGWHWLSWSEYPMIRLLVGPYAERPTVNVTFDCSDPNGAIYSTAYDELCGQTLEVVANSSQRYVFVPITEDDNYPMYVNEILVNGDVVWTNDTTNNFENFYAEDYTHSFEIEGDDLTISATFVHYELGAINTAEPSVKMSLYPNPATSSAQLNIEGVEGMVELSLIDMSGRVIRTNKVNAETANTINLNGLAKGAYFVRITNSNMTKVEKLIVR